MSQFEICPPNQRWLDRAAKARAIAEWDDTKRRWRSGELVGVGAPDAAIIPYCDEINRLEGVCTLQSCAGHRNGPYIEPAHLWLWLSREVATAFDSAVFDLVARRKAVDCVSKLFTRDGKEIAVVTFYGTERDSLDFSANAIVQFLRRIMR